MVSMVETSIPAHNDEAMDSIAPKSEPVLEGSASSSVSTPEAEAEPLTQDVAQTQKRKGGRKPIYATSEERKQRNRQAQAAFRERRTEYIRQLETTIKRNEEALQALQQNHRSAADECLMLRYKNSLLERVLLEKGIDVQAELRLKATDGGPIKQNPMMSKAPSAIERTAANRSSGQRPRTGINPSEPFGASQHRDATHGGPSPQFQATPSSHAPPASPKTSPGFAIQGTISPVDHGQQAHSQMLPQHRNLGQSSQPVEMRQSKLGDPKPNMGGGTGPRPPGAPPFYPSPFQRHYDQLEQEYDAQADLVDDGNDSVDDVSSYIPGLQASGSSAAHGVSNFNPSSGERSNETYSNVQHLLGNYDPLLDADPFGLSASMHFQTPFSYEQNNTRH